MNVSGKINCPECKAENKIDANFCHNCGFSFESIQSMSSELQSQDTEKVDDSELEIFEQKRLRVYSMFILMAFMLIIFITMASLIPEYIGLILGIGLIILCPLGSLTFYEYSNNLRKKFSISKQEIKLQKTYKLIRIKWDDFDILRIKAKGPFHWDLYSYDISREYTKFRIHFIDQKTNKRIQSLKFRFYNKAKAQQILSYLSTYARLKYKQVIVKKKHMG